MTNYVADGAMQTLSSQADQSISGTVVARPDRLLRLDQVKERVGLGKTLIYRLVQTGTFPAPCRPGGSAVRWSENEIVDWIAACAAQRKH